MKVSQVQGALPLPHKPISPNGITRRTLLKVGAASFLGAMFPTLSYAGAKPPYAEKLKGLAIPHEIVQVRENPTPIVLIWLDGGSSQFDTWDPKPDASDDIRGYFGSINTTVPGVRVSEFLPHTAEIMDNVLLLRNIYSTDTPDHFDGRTNWFTGSPEINRSSGLPIYPSLAGRFSNEVLRPRGEIPLTVINANYSSNPDSILIQPQGSLGVKYSADKNGFPSQFGEAIDKANLEARIALRRSLALGEPISPETKKYEGLFSSAKKALESGLTEVFDLTKIDPRIREQFGKGPLGNAALTTVNLVRAGAKFFVIHFGYWDSHYSLHKDIPDLVPPLDKAFSSLVKELKDEAIIVVASEFGRTPKLNKGFPSVGIPGGRDHWSKGYSIVLAGKGIQNGIVGATDNNSIITGQDGEFHSTHAISTILKLAGYELRWKESKQSLPVWPII